jgi:predicted phosphoribosyltransferase
LERSALALAREVDELCCANVRGGASFAVAAYQIWRDVTEDELGELLRSRDESGQGAAL